MRARPNVTSSGVNEKSPELSAAVESARAGKGLVVGLTGEPGIGKSTLVELFLADQPTWGSDCLVAIGRCSELLAASDAYLAVLDALDGLLQAPARMRMHRPAEARRPHLVSAGAAVVGRSRSRVCEHRRRRQDGITRANEARARHVRRRGVTRSAARARHGRFSVGGRVNRRVRRVLVQETRPAQNPRRDHVSPGGDRPDATSIPRRSSRPAETGSVPGNLARAS